MIDEIRKRALKLISPNRNYVINSDNKSVRKSSPFLIKSKGALKWIPLLAVESLQARYLSTGSRIIR